MCKATIKKSVLGVFVVVLLTLFYGVMYYAPMRMDDFDFVSCYQQQPSGQWEKTGKIITEMDEVFDAYTAHRTLKNGRMSDFFAMLFLNMGGKAGFAAITTFAAAVFAMCGSLLCYKRVSITGALLFAGLCLLLLPNLHGTVFWTAGSCNYFLGGALWLVGVMLANRHAEKRQLVALTGLTCLLFAFIGSLHEALGAASLFMMFFWLLVTRIRLGKNESRYFFNCLLLFFFFALSGFVFAMSSPAIWNRVDGALDYRIDIKTVIVFFINIILWVLALFVCVRKCKRDILYNPIFYFCLANLLIIVVLCSEVRNHGSRYYGVFGVLVLLQQAYGERIWCCRKYILPCLFVVLLVCGMSFFQQYKRAHDWMQAIIAKSETQRVQVLDTWKNPEITDNYATFISVCMPYQLYHIKQSAWKYWQCKPFICVINSLVSNRKVYEVFEMSSSDEVQVAALNGYTYIRLPKGYDPLFDIKLELCSKEDGSKITADSYVYSSSLVAQWYIKYIEKQDIIRYCLDYDGECFYVVFASELDGKYEFNLRCEDARHVVKSLKISTALTVPRQH